MARKIRCLGPIRGASLRSTRVGALACMTALTLLLHTAPALGMEPERSTSDFHHTNPDVLNEPGSTQQCDFPVVGKWAIHSEETDYFDQTTGTLTRIVIFDQFEGTLSNPLSGKSIPDAGHGRFTIYFAPDGSVSIVYSEESRQNPLLPIYGRFVYDADENIIKDVGHSSLSYNKHPFSIAPLCEALS